MSFLKIGVLSSFCLLLSIVSRANIDPKIQWKTLQTQNFEIIYPEELEDIGQYYANVAERVHKKLVPIFRDFPQKTLVILNDSTDFVNGSATFFPYPIITIYLNLPSPFSDISYYDDWTEMLFLHEYVHILNMHPANGFYLPLKYIFGSVVRPNGLLPRWYLEGLAVELESRLTTKGRLNSALSDAILRTLVINNTLRKETIDRINETSIPDWPGGRRPYLLGSLLMSEALNSNYLPNENIYNLNQIYSKRVPYFITNPIERITGKSWTSWLDETYLKVENSANYQLQILNQNPSGNFKKMSFKMDSQMSPSLSPDGEKLAFVAGNYLDNFFAVYISNTKSEPASHRTAKKVFSGHGIDRISWLPDSSAFVFSTLRPVDRFSILSDLFLYDLKTKKIKQLTYRARALEPEVSPDGKFIYYVKSGANRSSLMRYSFETSHIEEIWAAPINHRIFLPSPIGGDEILFGYKSTDGKERLIIINEIHKEQKQVLNEVSSVKFLKFSDNQLLFVSDESNVPNLYKSSYPFYEFKALTNSKTAIINADYSLKNKQLIISELTALGPQLFEEIESEEKNPPIVPHLMTRRSLTYSEEYPVRQKLQQPEMNFYPQEIYEHRDYVSTKFMLPQFWIPFVYAIEGGYLFQGYTAAFDPLSKQGYSLDLSYDSLSENISGVFTYNNNMTPVGMNFSYGQINEFRPSSGLNVKSEFLNAGTHFLISDDNSLHGLAGGVYSSSQDFWNQDLNRMGISAGISYTNAGHFNWQPRDNRLSASLFYQKFFPGRDFIDFNRYFSRVRYDFTKPLPSRHTYTTQVVSSYAHDLDLNKSIFIGDTNLGANFATNLVNSSFLLRGYPTGTFVGRSMTTLNMEYSLPIRNINSGFSTSAFFLKDLFATAFVDALTTDGAAFSAEKRGYYRKRWGEDIFTGTGLELTLNTTVGFHLPLFFKLGLYYGFDTAYQGGFNSFLAIGFGGISSLDIERTKSLLPHDQLNFN